ncbi:MAG: alanine racemase [Bacteroidales bacterium]|nr:alanine racemase [Bacteroidales bacterium]
MRDDFSRLEISLSKCLYNYRYFRSKLQETTRLLVLVKANAYGHGACQYARMLQDAGADYLAVALPTEGVTLRTGGIHLPILVLTAGVDHFPEIIDFNLEPCLPTLEAVRSLVKILRKRQVTDYPVHIKLDTGMHRLGFMTDELPELMDYLKECPQIKVKSIYSHLAVADDPSMDEFTYAQAELFQKNASAITASLGYKPMWHLLNSAGMERFPQFQFDMTRLGIGIYGVSALPGVSLKPVASLKCKILQIKHLTPEDGAIGYGRHGKIAPDGTVIATLPLGYADGIDRHFGNGKVSFMLNGHRVPTIGNICMDMCMIDITGVEAKVGDTVTVFGEDPTAEELAGVLGTIPYEIMTSVAQRINREITE